MRNCQVCLKPETCDCICSTCSNARWCELSRGKTEQSREYARAHGFDTVEIKMSGAYPSYSDFIIKWADIRKDGKND